MCDILCIYCICKVYMYSMTATHFLRNFPFKMTWTPEDSRCVMPFCRLIKIGVAPSPSTSAPGGSWGGSSWAGRLSNGAFRHIQKGSKYVKILHLSFPF